ncbi:MAG: cupin domain-containing protein [Gemmatimonadota bacterium]|nr:cupin domain-containing protein [Gemmatimonadota bacterium]
MKDRIAARTILFAVLVCGSLAAVPGGLEAQQASYEPATSGTRWLVGGNGFSIKLLVEASNLGGEEVELGEVTFPVGAGARGGGHVHGRVEIFYILSGTFDHIVNGEAHRLTPGMVGIVRPGDEVIHRVVGDEPVRALVVWAPAGEADRIAGGFEVRPIDDPPPF